MGIQEVAAAVMAGRYDVFDAAMGVVDAVEGLVENMEAPCTLLVAQGLFEDAESIGMSVYDPKQRARETLATARVLIEDARQLTLSVHEEV